MYYIYVYMCVYTHTHTHTYTRASQVAALVVKNPPASAGDTKDMGSIPRSGRSPGVGNGNLLQYSYLDSSMVRGAWRAVFHGATESNTTEQLSSIYTYIYTYAHIYTYIYIYAYICIYIHIYVGVKL